MSTTCPHCGGKLTPGRQDAAQVARSQLRAGANLLRRLDLRVSHEHQQRNLARHEICRRAVRAGLSRSEVARELGVSEHSVREWLNYERPDENGPPASVPAQPIPPMHRRAA